MKATLGFFANATQGDLSGDETFAVDGVTTDTRTMREGSLYIPLIGDRFDGHEFLEDAVQRGISSFLWQKDHVLPNKFSNVAHIVVEDTLVALQNMAHAYRKSLPVKIVAITGSNGKTSTKDMVKAVLSTTYRVDATKGNFNNHIGLPLSILAWSDDIEIAVLEMGMSALGEIKRLCEIAEPDVGVITNIGEAHIGLLGSREMIASAKWELIEALPPNGVAILPANEPLITNRYIPHTVRAIFVGDGLQTELYSENYLQMDDMSCQFTVMPEGDVVHLSAPGRHQAQNALCALAVGHAFHVPKHATIEALRSVQLTQMRMEVSKVTSDLMVINDAYNAAPASVYAALDVLKDTGCDRLVFVFGDMLELGEYAKQLHEQIGRRLEYYGVTDVVAVGDFAPFVLPFLPSKQSKSEDGLHLSVSDIGFAKDTILETIKRYRERGLSVAVLIKGSRRMRLEQLAQQLVMLS